MKDCVAMARMVLWAFFGVRRGSAHARDVQSARALPLIVIAVCAALLFIGLLLAVVHLVLRLHAA